VLLPETSRALEVGEQERDGPGRQLGHSRSPLRPRTLISTKGRQ
jgi:hypothetical protein